MQGREEEKQVVPQQWQMAGGNVQAEAGVKDCSSFQTLTVTVTRAQRPGRRVGT